jgi:Kef-type K+ transport system membrane component KefB/nucleotide-binding universal stress UspA family protein
VTSDHTLAIFITQLVLLLLTGRLLGEAMTRLGQPALFGQLLAGVLLGPSVFGALLPDLRQLIFPDTPTFRHMTNALSEVGVMFLLLLTGMETDLSLMARRRRAMISSSLMGIAVPFLCGVALAYGLPTSLIPRGDERLVTALFLGTALAISSVKIVAMTLMEIGVIRRDIGQLILSAAILDDTLAWIIIAIISGIAMHGVVSLTGIGASLAGVAVFLAFSLTIGRRLVAGLILLVNDHMKIEVPVITAILVVMFVTALTTELIGVHTALGAFVAGLLVGQSPILRRHIESQLRGFIFAFFSPVFFAVAGLGMDLRTLMDPTLLVFTGAIITAASIGKFSGALVGGWLGGLTTRESLAMATGLNARGSTEVIIASIGLTLGALSHELYTMIVAMAVLTTMAMPPTLRWMMARVPLREEEAKRLEKEEAEEAQSLPKMERALVYVNDSPNGRLAARLAGLFASRQHVLTTVLEVPAEKSDEQVVGHEGVAKASRADGKKDNSVTALMLTRSAASEDTLRRELRRGYDIVFAGLDRPLLGDSRHFDLRLQALVSSFKGPVAIAIHGASAAGPAVVPLDILLPTSGTSEARLATEVAMALAGATTGQLSALHVFQPRDDIALLSARDRRPGISLLVDARRLGKFIGVRVKGLTATNDHPDREISRVLRGGSFNLVVLGTSLRQGETRFLGSRMASLLGRIKTPALVIAR